MHLHILGICGTFMGSLALLARELGYKVSGSDQNVYPPMSTQLQEQGISLAEGYNPAHLTPAPDMVVIGNALSRGNPMVEAVLERRLPYISGPQWLHDHVLVNRRVLAVAGTHGKTTTASLLAWILEFNGLQPGFLIGGVPENFAVSARLGESDLFVIEADEYDTAFFDKRSKFVHYCPEIVLLNNLEYDHADIFPDIEAIIRQFHHLLRIIPGNGKVIVNGEDDHLRQTLQLGCWTPVDYFGEKNSTADISWQGEAMQDDASQFALYHDGRKIAEVNWDLLGNHNMLNAIAAVAAATAAGAAPNKACKALASFRSVKRRLQHVAKVNGVRIYEDFAHHPTAIRKTLAALRASIGKDKKLYVAFEPRSNTMRMGVHGEVLLESFVEADKVMILAENSISEKMGLKENPFGKYVQVFDQISNLMDAMTNMLQPGDTIVIMSNGSFDGLAQRLPSRLKVRNET